MALTDIQKVRLTVGDNDPNLPLLTDNEYEYFLEKNEGNITRTAKESAKTILFKLAGIVREKTLELEYYGSDYFKNYKEALMLYLSDANFGDVASAMPYAGGISLKDIQANLENADNYTVPFENTVPVELAGINVNNNSPFVKSNLPRKSPFDI